MYAVDCDDWDVPLVLGEETVRRDEMTSASPFESLKSCLSLVVASCVGKEVATLEGCVSCRFSLGVD